MTADGPAVDEVGTAEPGTRPDEVVIAVGPAFAGALGETINGLPHDEVLAAIVEGVREEGAEPRVVRVRRSADVAFIGHDGALLSGSGIAVGLQSKGTALIHRADLQPLDNLELFGMAPSLTLESYRQIGRNAAGYALGRPVAPVPTVLDNYARAKLIVRTTAAARAGGGRGRPRRRAGRAAPPRTRRCALTRRTWNRCLGTKVPGTCRSRPTRPLRPRACRRGPSGGRRGPRRSPTCATSAPGASSVSISASVRRSISATRAPASAGARTARRGRAA